MKYEQFINQVAERTGLSKDEAGQQAISFFEMLGARIQQNETNDLASQLPSPLDEAVLSKGDEMDKAGAREFFERIGSSSSRSGEETQEYAAAIWSVLNEAVAAGELRDVRANLPEDLVETLDGSLR